MFIFNITQSQIIIIINRWQCFGSTKSQRKTHTMYRPFEITNWLVVFRSDRRVLNSDIWEYFDAVVVVVAAAAVDDLQCHSNYLPIFCILYNNIELRRQLLLMIVRRRAWERRSWLQLTVAICPMWVAPMKCSHFRVSR